MPEQATSVLLAQHILRSPYLFDKLGPPKVKGEGETRVGRRGEGAATAGLCRDLVLYAALNKKRTIELRVPDFCREMGYDSSNLMRRCTDEQIQEIKDGGDIDEEDVAAFSNMLGLAVVRLLRYNFIFADKGGTSKLKKYKNNKIVESIDLYKPQKNGTLLTFTLCEEILEHNRKAYQTLYKEEYLSLRTQSTTRKLGHPGHPDDAARKMYMRLRGKRGYWDYCLKEGLLEQAKNEETDSYTELLKVAGLNERRDYWPEKRVACELRKLLNRIAGMASIRLTPTVALKMGRYEVTWKHLPFAPAAAPAPVVAKPSKQVERRPAAKPTRTSSKVASPPTPATKPAPAAAARPAVRNVQKLKDEEQDLLNSLRWLESDDAKAAPLYVKEPAKRQEHINGALARLSAIQQELVAQ